MVPHAGQKLHHGKGERFMLAEELTEGRMCLSCHSDKQSVLGSSHDLRKDFPEERNRLGMTPATGGPCSSCHLFHRYARAPQPAPLDPLGLCTTCHLSGRPAEAKTLGSVNHPQAHCTDCHNPHDKTFPNYLKAAPQDICITCHLDQAALAGGPHDIRTGSSAWGSMSGVSHDACMACRRREESRVIRRPGCRQLGCRQPGRRNLRPVSRRPRRRAIGQSRQTLVRRTYCRLAAE